MPKKLNKVATKLRSGHDELLSVQERIAASVAKWIDVLGLSTQWREITILYKDAADAENYHVAGMASVWWQYKEATITFFLPKFVDEDDEYIDYVVRHELMHVLVNEMRDDAGKDNIDHEERVVTDLAMAFKRVADAARDGLL